MKGSVTIPLFSPVFTLRDVHDILGNWPIDSFRPHVGLTCRSPYKPQIDVFTSLTSTYRFWGSKMTTSSQEGWPWRVCLEIPKLGPRDPVTHTWHKKKGFKFHRDPKTRKQNSCFLGEHDDDIPICGAQFRHSWKLTYTVPLVAINPVYMGPFLLVKRQVVPSNTCHKTY